MSEANVSVNDLSEFIEENSDNKSKSQISRLRERMDKLQIPHIVIDDESSADEGDTVYSGIKNIDASNNDITCYTCRTDREIDNILKLSDDTNDTVYGIDIETVNRLKKIIRDNSIKKIEHIKTNNNDTETKYRVYILIRNIADGGETHGIHFGLLKEKIVKKESVLNKFYRYCIVKSVRSKLETNEDKIVLELADSGIYSETSYIVRNYFTYSTRFETNTVNEYINGHTLEQLLYFHPERITNDMRKKITIDIYRTLRLLHQRYFIHLDIKPGNIMVDRFGNIKIIDFGKSIKFRESDTIDGECIDSTAVMKFMNRAIGTPNYIPPNILVDNKFETIQDYNVLYNFMILLDLWSYGMTIYDLFMNDTYYDRELMCLDQIIDYMSMTVIPFKSINLNRFQEKIHEDSNKDLNLEALMCIVETCLTYRPYYYADKICDRLMTETVIKKIDNAIEDLQR